MPDWPFARQRQAAVKAGSPAARTVDRRAWLILPALLLVTFTFVFPVGWLLARSAYEPAWGLGNFREIFSEPVYAKIIWNTVVISASVTFFCLLLGFPLSYTIAQAGPTARKILIVIIMVPLWTSILVQAYAWVVLLQDNGILNKALIYFGVIKEPISMIYNRSGVLIALTQAQLPLMVLPLYGVMTRLDPNLTKASSVLGAPPMMTFMRVYLPQTLPGIISGCSLVFALCLGYYITPALVGGHSDTMIGQLIMVEIEELGDWGMAGALSLVLLIGMALIFGLLSLLGRRSRSWVKQ